ncbi:PREDICTED: high mobility group B protein 6-like [Amphimedon queenslandica]|uniref:HMG box domain-containing protein n=1 Tax=Amphimedon queenslandica TaxID=400682 RepID=A0A1X7UN92_AMPQE|nr:PREDICTED: high mobility group B protein 6-like [Amphimedon queenslandica]|eukprot:XP_003387350.1 PREDICTED: high mobility group B protein 6-like [Amphimedon queenslandica]
MALSFFSSTRSLFSPLISRSITVSCPLYFKKPLLGNSKPPKRPPSSFSLFVKDKWGESNNAVSSTERMKELTKIWLGMTAEEQKSYKELYKKLQEQYLQKREDFFGKFTEKEILAYKKNLEKYKKKIEKSKEKRKAIEEGTYDPPPGRTLTGYNLFIAEQTSAPLIGTESIKERMTGVAAKWKSLSNEEKLAYKEEAAAVTQKRIEEYCERHPEYIQVLEAQRENKTVKKSSSVA